MTRKLFPDPRKECPLDAATIPSSLEVKSARDLRTYLAAMDIPQQDFANWIGVSTPVLSGLLHGRRKLTPILRITVEQVLAEAQKYAPDDPDAVGPVHLPIPRIRRL
jgi:hypothetical protein